MKKIFNWKFAWIVIGAISFILACKDKDNFEVPFFIGLLCMIFVYLEEILDKLDE